jgi:hypothetical protein
VAGGTRGRHAHRPRRSPRAPEQARDGPGAGWTVTIEVVLLSVAADGSLAYRVLTSHLPASTDPDAAALAVSGLDRQPPIVGAVSHATSWRATPNRGVVLTYTALPDPNATGGVPLKDPSIDRAPDRRGGTPVVLPVEAHDGIDLISHGTHERTVIPVRRQGPSEADRLGSRSSSRTGVHHLSAGRSRGGALAHRCLNPDPPLRLDRLRPAERARRAGRCGVSDLTRHAMCCCKPYEAVLASVRAAVGSPRRPGGRVARGNPVRVRDCPAAVSGNDRRHQALGFGPGSDGQ